MKFNSLGLSFGPKILSANSLCQLDFSILLRKKILQNGFFAQQFSIVSETC